MRKHDMLKELVHYICWRCRSNPGKLGGTKLNKILWYVDTYSYRRWGRSMSGEQNYLKKQYGPVPIRIDEVLGELQLEKKLNILVSEFYGYQKYEFIPLEKANIRLFDDERRNIIDEIIDDVCDNHTAVSISNLSHDSIWRMAKNYEEIPIYTVLASTPDKLSDKDYAWADKIIKQYVVKGA